MKWTEEVLDDLLTTPSDTLVADIAKIQGDIMVLGAGGKMGPTLCVLAKNAIKKAGIDKKVVAVSRFTDKFAVELLKKHDVEIISCDLLDVDALNNLPELENVIYMAGRKFGTDGSEWQTWAMNATLPAFVAKKFRKSNLVVFSSGNIYPMVSITSGGCSEADKPAPIGEYAMSCLARERAFEYAANTFGTKVFLYRLSFAVDLRYGVIYDIAEKILSGTPISVTTPVLNCIWQGTANEIALRGLLHTTSPANIVNVTGPETLSVRYIARELSKKLGKEPVFCGEEGQDAYISNAGKTTKLFGYPAVSAETLIEWQGDWILSGGRGLGKPTHFEERKGSY
ncbi:MAG: NAD-dependent epimerase/dehydratase family protein [Ruthenibacterium sp.]